MDRLPYQSSAKLPTILVACRKPRATAVAEEQNSVCALSCELADHFNPFCLNELRCNRLWAHNKSSVPLVLRASESPQAALEMVKTETFDTRLYCWTSHDNSEKVLMRRGHFQYGTREQTGKKGVPLRFHVGLMCTPFSTVTFTRHRKQGPEFHVVTPLVQDIIPEFPVGRFPFPDGCSRSSFSTLHTCVLCTLPFISPQSRGMFAMLTTPLM